MKTIFGIKIKPTKKQREALRLKEQVILAAKKRQQRKQKIGTISIGALAFIVLSSLILALSEPEPPVLAETLHRFTIITQDQALDINDFIDLEFEANIPLSAQQLNSVQCHTSDESIVTIINQKLFAFSQGEAQITCTLDQLQSNTLTIEVLANEIIVNPTQPGDEDPVVVNPTQPTNPTQPSNPTTPTQPTNPTPPPSNPVVDLNQALVVSYIDVGQGDSILIQTPQKKNILIDAGTSTYGPRIEQYLKSKGIDTIHVLIATHPHADHIGGMEHIINQFNIESVYMPKASTTTRTFENLLLAIQNKGLRINTARAGVVLDVDSSITARFVAPISENYSDLNQFSAVLRITYKNVSFLFTGDAGQLSENEMIASGVNLRANVLKVGHHGSSTSTTHAFLNAVRPEIAIIPVGESNRYGHPHQVVLDRLTQAGVRIFRTDTHGTIVISSDGTNIRID